MEKQKDRKYEENGKLLEDIIKLPEKNEREGEVYKYFPRGQKFYIGSLEF